MGRDGRQAEISLVKVSWISGISVWSVWFSHCRPRRRLCCRRSLRRSERARHHPAPRRLRVIIRQPLRCTASRERSFSVCWRLRRRARHQHPPSRRTLGVAPRHARYGSTWAFWAAHFTSSQGRQGGRAVSALTHVLEIRRASHIGKTVIAASTITTIKASPQMAVSLALGGARSASRCRQPCRRRHRRAQQRRLHKQQRLPLRRRSAAAGR